MKGLCVPMPFVHQDAPSFLYELVYEQYTGFLLFAQVDLANASEPIDLCFGV